MHANEGATAGQAQAGEELRNAWRANYKVRSDHAEFKTLVDVVTKRIVQDTDAYRRAPPKPRRLAAAVRWLLLNVLYARSSDPTRYVAIRMGANAYRGRFGYGILRRVVEALVRQGLCVLVTGFKDRETGKGYLSRLRGTEALAALAIECGVNWHMIAAGAVGRLVRLRSERAAGKRNQRWPADPESKAELRRMTENLKLLNSALSESFIALHVSDAVLGGINERLGREQRGHRWVDFRRKQLYRVFNDGSRTLGGRMVGGWWQAIPREYRKYIHLAAKDEYPLWTVELDYRSIQPSLLYAAKRIRPPEDCYAINEQFRVNKGARDYAKDALLIMLNARNREAAESAIRSHVVDSFDAVWSRENPEKQRPTMTVDQMVPAGCPGVSELVAALAKYHEPISESFFDDAGKRLMYLESNIAENVLLQMNTKGIVTLPVHDSFLVRKGNQGSLRAVMNEAFRDQTGFYCEVTVDESELDEFRTMWGNTLGREMGHEDLIRQIRSSLNGTSIYRTMAEDWQAQLNATRTSGMIPELAEELPEGWEHMVEPL